METENQTIKCKAAILWNPKEPLSVEEVEVAPPKAGEVRIKILFTSLCHTDFHIQLGENIAPFYTGPLPVILGHEATGRVESVGEGVTGLRPGDTVIPCSLPQCGRCASCLRPDSNMCEANVEQQARGVMADGSTRFTCRGQPVYHFLGCSTFSEYTVCSEVNVCKIDPHAQLDKVCLIGCCFCTGYGAAVETCKVREGSTVAVWGLGGVGLCVIAGAKACGAKTIIGIDSNEQNFDRAMRMGATHCVNPNKYREGGEKQTFVNYLLEEYAGGVASGGFDYTFECVGDIKTMRDCLEAAHKGWGVCCVLGVTDIGAEIPVPSFQVIQGRHLVGCTMGGVKTRDAIPAWVSQTVEGGGKLPEGLFEDLIGNHVPFSEINKAFELMGSGVGARTIIEVGGGH